MNANLVLPRVCYLVRAGALGCALLAPLVLPFFVPELFRNGFGAGQALMLAMGLVAWLPIAALTLREALRILFPPEGSTRMVLLSAGYQGVSPVLNWIFRPPLGAVGLGFGLAVSFFLGPVGWGIVWVAWAIGFGDQRTTYIPSRRLLLLEGYFVPTFARLDKAKLVSVHVTEIRGSHGYRSRQYKPVVMSWKNIEVGEIGSDAQAAQRRAMEVSRLIGLPYADNPSARDPYGYNNAYNY